MNGINALEAFLSSAARGLCRHPEKVNVSSKESGSCTVCFNIDCDKSDVGLLTGKEHRTIVAIRIIAYAIATKNGLKVSVIVNE